MELALALSPALSRTPATHPGLDPGGSGRQFRDPAQELACSADADRCAPAGLFLACVSTIRRRCHARSCRVGHQGNRRDLALGAVPGARRASSDRGRLLEVGRHPARERDCPGDPRKLPRALPARVRRWGGHLRRLHEIPDRKRTPGSPVALSYSGQGQLGPSRDRADDGRGHRRPRPHGQLRQPARPRCGLLGIYPAIYDFATAPTDNRSILVSGQSSTSTARATASGS